MEILDVKKPVLTIATVRNLGRLKKLSFISCRDGNFEQNSLPCPAGTEI